MVCVSDGFITDPMRETAPPLGAWSRFQGGLEPPRYPTARVEWGGAKPFSHRLLMSPICRPTPHEWVVKDGKGRDQSASIHGHSMAEHDSLGVVGTRETNSKTVEGNLMRVRVPPSAPCSGLQMSPDDW